MAPPTHGAEGGSPATAERVDRYADELRRQINASESDVEKAVLQGVLVLHEAEMRDDRAAMEKAVGDLIVLGGRDTDDEFCARALMEAADGGRSLGRTQEAVQYYQEARKRYASHSGWKDAPGRAVYCGIRVGDAWIAAGDPGKAVDEWTRTFDQYSHVPAAAQIPEKARQAFYQYLDHKEAWTKGLQLFDRAISSCADAKHVDRFELERLYTLLDGVRSDYISAAEWLAQADALLAKYPPGASRLLDLRRKSLLEIKNGIARTMTAQRMSSVGMSTDQLANAAGAAVSASDLTRDLSELPQAQSESTETARAYAKAPPTKADPDKPITPAPSVLWPGVVVGVGIVLVAAVVAVLKVARGRNSAKPVAQRGP